MNLSLENLYPNITDRSMAESDRGRNRPQRRYVHNSCCFASQCQGQVGVSGQESETAGGRVEANF